jgi:hypothetical protein
MLDNSGCLYGLLEKPGEVVLLTSEKTNWLEDQSLEFGLSLLRWNFPSRAKQRWSFVSPTLSHRWQQAEDPGYKAKCSQVLKAQCKAAELVLLPVFSSDHWVLLVLDMRDEEVFSVRYFDRLKEPSDSCRFAAQLALSYLSEKAAVPVRHSLYAQLSVASGS